MNNLPRLQKQLGGNHAHRLAQVTCGRLKR
jgi:hypothetical protein